jgi:hypothetical protein
VALQASTIKEGFRFKPSDFLLVAVCLAGAARLLWIGAHGGQDFEVYWKASKACFNGLSPYLIKPEDNGFVFKYPPWILPLFFPFGLLTLPQADFAWSSLELLAVFLSVWQVARRCASPRAALWSALLFWWIWLAHFAAGQFTLVLLAAGLLLGRSEAALATLGFLFSSKIFSLISLFPFWRTALKVKMWAVLLALLVASQLIVLGVYGKTATRGAFDQTASLFHDWKAASSSGGSQLGHDVVRGQGNHGFTAGVLRWLEVDEKAFLGDVLVFCILALGFGFGWTRVSRSFEPFEKWVGWLALGVIVHPLAWHHSFVMCYPLCAIALDRALRARRKSTIFLALLGIVCIGIFVPQAIGKTLVKPLELVSVKSWGVVLSAWALWRAKQVLSRFSASEPSVG